MVWILGTLTTLNYNKLYTIAMAFLNPDENRQAILPYIPNSKEPTGGTATGNPFTL
jgi:hypothetical protein